jgi:membrane-associated phospholipid phosphatase
MLALGAVVGHVTARRGLTGIVAAVLHTSSTQKAERGRIGRSYAPSAWVLGSATLLLLVFAMRWELSLRPFPGDAWAAQLGASHKPWLVYAITRVYQQVGRPIVAVGEVLLMVVWLWRTSGPRVAKGLLITLLASASCGVIKEVCGPTPFWLALHHVGTDFPSGVVTFVTAAGGYLATVAKREGRSTTAAIIIAVIVGAGPARILGGQHVLSDVIGGYMLGGAWLIAAHRYAYAALPARRLLEEPAWSIASLEPAPKSAELARMP